MALILNSSLNNNITGTEGDDTVSALFLENGADVIRGLGGNDKIEGGGNNDFIDGGLGDDRIEGGTGNDTVDFSSWNVLPSNALSRLSSTITLADGAGEGQAVLERSPVIKLVGSATATVETDTLVGIENVRGSTFSDTITGNSGDNTLDGGGGSDILAGGRGNDTLIGGDGIDTASFAEASSFINSVSVTASLVTGTAAVTRSSLLGSTVTETDTLSGIENLIGSDGGDKLTGNDAANVLTGNKGADTLVGLGGADTLNGGDGTDLADYGASAAGVSVDLTAGTGAGGDAAGDKLSGIENVNGSQQDDTLTGSDANNFFTGNGGNDTMEGRGGADTMDGSSGTNTLSYEGSAGVTMSLDGTLTATGDASGDVISNFANLTGSATGNDTLRGDASANLIRGLGGDDTLSGGAGADTLDGGDGFDSADYRNDGAIDIDLAAAIFGGAAEGDSFIGIEQFIGGLGDNVMKGDSGSNDFLVFSGTNLLLGRGGDDTLTGGSGFDTVKGGGGGDLISGNGGDDKLLGNAGSDTIKGGDGNDTINGGGGSDTMSGGLGDDIFVFKGRNSGTDTITDFQDGADILEFNIRGIDALSDFSIAGNGTTDITLVFNGQSIALHGASAINLTADDFNFL